MKGYHRQAHENQSRQVAHEVRQSKAIPFLMRVKMRTLSVSFVLWNQSFTLMIHVTHKAKRDKICFSHFHCNCDPSTQRPCFWGVTEACDQLQVTLSYLGAASKDRGCFEDAKAMHQGLFHKQCICSSRLSNGSSTCIGAGVPWHLLDFLSSKSCFCLDMKNKKFDLQDCRLWGPCICMWLAGHFP